METMKLVQQHAEEMIAIRRHLHQNPELSNEEYKTTELIKGKLTEYGIEVVDKIAGCETNAGDEPIKKQVIKTIRLA